MSLTDIANLCQQEMSHQHLVRYLALPDAGSTNNSLILADQRNLSGICRRLPGHVSYLKLWRIPIWLPPAASRWSHLGFYCTGYSDSRHDAIQTRPSTPHNGLLRFA